MLPLQRSIFLRTGLLIALLVGGISVTLALFMVRDQRRLETARARAMAIFLAERVRPYVAAGDHAGLHALLAQIVAGHGGVTYVVVERGERVFVETSPGLLPPGQLHRTHATAGRPAVRELTLRGGAAVYDTAVLVDFTDIVVHVGSPRPPLAESAGTRLTIAALIGLAAILFGLGLAWRIALLTTHEVARQERALRASERRYRQLFDQAPESILLLDLKGPRGVTILDANEATLRHHGYTRDELLGRPVADLDSPRDRVHVEERARLIRTGRTVTFDAEHVRKDGSIFPVEVIAQLIEIDGKPVVQAIDRDVSERRRAEEERARLEAQLAQAQRLQAIGQLAGGVAHDLNNILAGVMGAASVLEAGLAPGDPHREHVGVVLDSCARGRDLTRNLLGFARQGAWVKEPLAVDVMVDETVAFLGRTVSRKIGIVTDPGADLGAVVGDRTQLGQALVNVCLNAVDAMPGGGTVTITTRDRRLAEPAPGAPGDGLAAGRYVEISVRDTGTGMDADTLARAFEPFFTTKAVGEGTGLGLAMVYGTVRSHGGAVRLESTPGSGTVVTLLLPVAGDVAPSAPPRAVPPAAYAGSGAVLLVDDEKLVRWAAESMLRKLGFDVLTARSGREALELYRAQRERVAFVVLDLVMPDLDGDETFGALRAIDPQVKVLIASGYSRDEKLESLLGRGVIGFIEKPFDLDQLARKLREVKVLEVRDE